MTLTLPNIRNTSTSAVSSLLGSVFRLKKENGRAPRVEYDQSIPEALVEETKDNGVRIDEPPYFRGWVSPYILVPERDSFPQKAVICGPFAARSALQSDTGTQQGLYYFLQNHKSNTVVFVGSFGSHVEFGFGRVRLGETAAACCLEAISVTTSSDGGESVRSRELKFEPLSSGFSSFLQHGADSCIPFRVLKSAGADLPSCSNCWEEFHPEPPRIPDFSFNNLTQLLATCTTLVPALSGRWELDEPGKQYSGRSSYSMFAFQLGTDSKGNAECIVLCVQSNDSDPGGGTDQDKAYFSLGIGEACLQQKSKGKPWDIYPLRIRKLSSWGTFVDGPRMDYEYWTGDENELVQTGRDTSLKRVSRSEKAGGASSLALEGDLREQIKKIFHEIMTVSFADAVVAGDLQKFNKVVGGSQEKDTIQLEPITLESLQRGRSGVGLLRENVSMIPILAAAMYGQEAIIEELLTLDPFPDVFVLAVACFCDKARDALLDAVKRDPALVKATCPPLRGLRQPHPLSHPRSRKDRQHPLHLEGCTLLHIVARCMFSAHSSWRSKYTASVEGLVRAGAEHTICTAIQCGDHAWVQEADLKPGELDVIFTADKYGNGAVPLGSHTPLTGAVFVNDLEMVNVLLDKGAALFKTRDSVRNFDTTAIHQAVMFDLDSANKFPTLRRLLRHYVKLRSDGARIPEDMENLHENLSGQRDPERHAGGGSWRDKVHQDAWSLIVNVDSFFSGGDEGLEFLDDAAGSLQIANLEGENVFASEGASARVPGAPVVPGYTCENLLGEGGQGSVWLARDEETQERVAIKVGVHASGNERYVREWKNMSLEKLAGHPNIVTFIRADKLDGVEWLVMEFVEGENLRERLKAVGKLELEDAVWVMVGLLSGLSGLHTHDIAHRDVKPENIMIRSKHPGKLSDKVVIVDLGLSKRAEINKTFTNPAEFLGTPAYFCPEATHPEKGVDVRADVWAAGVVFFEMLDGRHPFHVEVHDPYFHYTIVRIRAGDAPQLPKGGDAHNALFQKALRKDPAERFRDATAMLEAFTEVCENRDDVPPSCKIEVVSAAAAAPEPTPAKRGVALFSARGGTDLQVHSRSAGLGLAGLCDLKTYICLLILKCFSVRGF